MSDRDGGTAPLPSLPGVPPPPPSPCLPRLVVVTDGSATGGRPLTDVVAAAVAGGARAVLLREKHLPRAARAALAGQLQLLLAAVGGQLLVASDAGIASTLSAAGVHLAAADPRPPAVTARSQGRRLLVGRSCHSAADVRRAAADGCDYVTLSPVFPTTSKPGYGPPLGLDALGGLVLPVWALGGVDLDHASSCLAAGAAGVAVMGAVMRAEDPAAVVGALCRAVGQQR